MASVSDYTQGPDLNYVEPLTLSHAADALAERNKQLLAFFLRLARLRSHNGEKEDKTFCFLLFQQILMAQHMVDEGIDWGRQLRESAKEAIASREIYKRWLAQEPEPDPDSAVA